MCKGKLLCKSAFNHSFVYRMWPLCCYAVTILSMHDIFHQDLSPSFPPLVFCRGKWKSNYPTEWICIILLYRDRGFSSCILDVGGSSELFLEALGVQSLSIMYDYYNVHVHLLLIICYLYLFLSLPSYLSISPTCHSYLPHIHSTEVDPQAESLSHLLNVHLISSRIVITTVLTCCRWMGEWSVDKGIRCTRNKGNRLMKSFVLCLNQVK